jgi:hypothetical protein
MIKKVDMTTRDFLAIRRIKAFNGAQTYQNGHGTNALFLSPVRESVSN